MATVNNTTILGNETLTTGPTYTPHPDLAAAAYAQYIVGIVGPVIFSILMTIGVLGNGSLIYIVLTIKCMRNVPNILIVSLSIADLMLLLMSAPFVTVLFVTDGYPFNTLVCKGNEYLQTFSVGVSVFTLTALSGDRYIAIVYPLSKHKGKPTLKIIVTVTIIWILSALLAIPDAVSYHIETQPGFDTTFIDTCQPFPREWEKWYPQAHSMFRFVTLFAIPLLIIGVFYCLMARILVKSSRQIPCESTVSSAMNQSQQRQIEARIKVAKVVLSFVILFIICWLPRHIYLLWFHWSEGDFTLFWYVFKTVGYCLTYVYACVNPYALYFLSSHFRKYYNRLLFRCCPKSYRRIPPESNPSLIYNSTMRRGSTSMTVVKANSEL